MKHSDFKIGTEFTVGGGKWLWRCTDVGTRTIAAICISHVDVITMDEEGKEKKKKISYEEALAAGWFDGPPYAVSEELFDEDDFAECCEQEFPLSRGE